MSARHCTIWGWLLAALAVAAPAAQAQYIPGAPCPAHEWANGYGFITGLACAQPNYADLAGTPPSANYALASGFVNKLRGNSLSQWYGGTSIVVSTAGAWASEGVYVAPSGAAVTVSQVASPQSGGPYYALKILGASGNTDVKLRFPVESLSAASLAGQTATFQVTYHNKSGGALTPALTTKYAGSQDIWTSPTTDLSTTNLQSCASNAICTAAYTFSISASANQGYAATVDFGALGSSAYVEVVRFDFRATPGIATGLNSAPPTPELIGAALDAIWCQRFYQTSYDNGVAPGSVTHSGLTGISPVSSSTEAGAVAFTTPMRADPAVSIWDGAGNAGKTSYWNGSAWVDNAVTISVPSTGQKGFTAYAGGGGNNTVFHWAADARISGG